MKKTIFTESQIIRILKSHAQGAKATDLARENGLSTATL